MTWKHARTPKGKYVARYRGPDRIERSKTFARKRDADNWRAEQMASLSKGDWTDPRSRKRTINTLGAEWLKTKQRLKKSSEIDYQRIWKVHVQPKWGTREIGSIRTSEIEVWVTELRERISVSRTRRAIMILRQILNNAVDDQLIGRNPVTRKIKPGEYERSIPRALTHIEVKKLIRAAGKDWGDVIEVLAYTGLRLSEATALTVQSLKFGTSPPTIYVETAQVEVSGKLYESTPKNGKGRTVPLTEDSLKALIRMSKSKAGDAYVFTPEDGQIGGKRFREVLRAACERAKINPPITPHNLRDTAASLAIQAGASIKTLQAMLGHASATMTLDRYASSFPADFTALISAVETAKNPKKATLSPKIAEPQRNREVRRAGR
jgi:integrase